MMSDSPRLEILGWILVLVVAGLFSRLGIWQLDRLQERTIENHQIEEQLSAPTVPLARALAEGGALDYRHVVVVGEYAPADEVLLRNRTYEGQNGFHVLTPLLMPTGRTILVDRGWIPTSLDQPPVAEMAPPAGTVQATGVLRSSRSAPALGPDDPATGNLRQIYWPDLTRLAGQMPAPMEPVYLELRSQIPNATTPQPLPGADPILTNGPHLSYAIQWFSFAIIAVLGYWLLMKRKKRGQ